MRKITVLFTSVLIEKGLETGNVLQLTVISQGLPSDSKLTGASLTINGDLELEFESEKSEGPDGPAYIELTTLKNI